MSSPPSIRSPWRHFGWYHFPALAYAAAIIAVSSVPNLRPPSVELVGLDKLLHLFEYAILALLAFRSLTHMRSALPPARAVWLAAVLVAAFACLDEFYQSFIPGRTTSGYDIAADLVGALLVLALVELRRRRSRHSRR